MANYGTAPAALSLSFSSASMSQLTTVQADSFSNTTDCGDTLGIGENCTIFIAFSPQANISSTYTVQATSYPGATPVTATLTGMGILDAPHLVVSPSFYSFGTLAPGSSASQKITLTNTGTQTANFYSGGGGGGSSYANTILGFSDCSETLAPGASCGRTFSFVAGTSDGP